MILELCVSVYSLGKLFQELPYRTRVAKAETRTIFFDLGTSNTQIIAIRATVSARSVRILIDSIAVQKANYDVHC